MINSEEQINWISRCGLAISTKLSGHCGSSDCVHSIHRFPIVEEMKKKTY